MLPEGESPFQVMNTFKFREDILETNIIDFMYIDRLDSVVGFLD